MRSIGGRKALPADTTVDLVDAEHRPFSPPLVSRPDEKKKVTFRLPVGVETFAVRVSMHGETTYSQEWGNHRGARDGWLFPIERFPDNPTPSRCLPD